MTTASVHEGRWVFVNAGSGHARCVHCGEFAHSYWAWFATATKYTTVYCERCADGLFEDDE
jgi:hypothetical protein